MSSKPKSELRSNSIVSLLEFDYKRGSKHIRVATAGFFLMIQTLHAINNGQI